MSFPELPFEDLCAAPDRTVIGLDFDILKRDSIINSSIGFNQKVFKFREDRMIPSRRQTNSEFLCKTETDYFDVSSSDNDIKVMRKVQYQNHIRKLFLAEQNEGRGSKENQKLVSKTKLVHTDWACKIPNIRLKFLPDFETLKKPGFGHIHDYIWSNKQIIAAASSKKVCLYYPFNGFTRALDIRDRVCIAFSNSGEFLAIAYRKSKIAKHGQDLYVFRINHKSLLENESLDTEKVITSTEYDVTALCYTRNDDFLMCGTNAGKILVFRCTPIEAASRSRRQNEARPAHHKWEFVQVLETLFHKKDIKKISFSCKFRYMASLDANGQLVVWNGGSWTILYCLQKDYSRYYKHLEWHPFVEEELIFGKSMYPALYLINVVRKEVVACYMNWKEDMELTSVAFNPVTAQLAVCFYIQEEFINRVSILASMSQVINTFDFEYIYGGLKLFWNASGTMLGAGAQTFRFAFWSFQKNNEFPLQIKGSASKNPVLVTLNDSKLSSLR